MTNASYGHRACLQLIVVSGDRCMWELHCESQNLIVLNILFMKKFSFQTFVRATSFVGESQISILLKKKLGFTNFVENAIYLYNALINLKRLLIKL